tara:strand:+ start:1315 stop:2658 length:1344 start_codon:yes stop_codon:yes gene_type:complete
MLIKSISGIRGLVSPDLTHEVIDRYISAFHQFCGEGTIVLGRDTRPSGFKLTSQILDHLIAYGRNVQDCGICPTPTVQFVVSDTEAAGGIVVTASHNPSDWNGLKFINKDGCFLNQIEFNEFLSIMDSETGEGAEEVSKGTYSTFDHAVNRHIQRILAVEFLDIPSIKNYGFKVAVDAVNGAASKALPNLLEKLDCDVIEINCFSDGDFSRGAEPLPSNLSELCDTVKNKNCHLGLAVDPDGDRLAIVDENGIPLGEEYTLVLAAELYMSSISEKSKVVTNLSTTLALEKLAERYNFEVIRSPVGEINVVEKMKKVGADFGGEGNGGVILQNVHLGRDSLVAAAMILDLMAKRKKPLSELFSTMPQYFIVKDKISINGINPGNLLEQISENYRGMEKNIEDGLKLLWEDRWVHIRSSNTEPILRIYAEAPTEGEAKSLVRDLREVMA